MLFRAVGIHQRSKFSTAQDQTKTEFISTSPVSPGSPRLLPPDPGRPGGRRLRQSGHVSGVLTCTVLTSDWPIDAEETVSQARCAKPEQVGVI